VKTKYHRQHLYQEIETEATEQTGTTLKSRSLRAFASASRIRVVSCYPLFVVSSNPMFKIPLTRTLQALKRYNITDDWRQYALYIVHGDQERCLGLDEKPLLLFKQLDKEGRKPMFMLRRHASPQEGWSGTTGGGGPSGGAEKVS
jgi:hypothetical protein